MRSPRSTDAAETPGSRADSPCGFRLAGEGRFRNRRRPSRPSVRQAVGLGRNLSGHLSTIWLAFSEVWMQPSGVWGWSGFATNATFHLRDALQGGHRGQFVTSGAGHRWLTANLSPDGFTDATAKRSRECWTVTGSGEWQAVAKSRNIKSRLMS